MQLGIDKCGWVVLSGRGDGWAREVVWGKEVVELDRVGLNCCRYWMESSGCGGGRGTAVVGWNLYGGYGGVSGSSGGVGWS